jgi:hypothetical protein
LSNFDRLNWLGAAPEIRKIETSDMVHAVFMHSTLKAGHFPCKLPIGNESRKPNSKELRIEYDVKVHLSFWLCASNCARELRP